MDSNSWPTPQDYNEAIQNPRACFSDPDLVGGSVDTNALGLPRAMTGAFASVYRINSQDKSWAVRCFLTSRLDQKDRYKHISDFVLFDDLECTIDFHYVEQGINVKGKWYPCLKMPWLIGDTLDVYLAKNYKTPGKIKRLLEDFHKMVDELECAGIGHGDMQHGNIIVTEAGLRLVDYDALYVPALLGRKSLELGHPNYQHPDRNEHHFDPDVDNFSCWLIHASLLALAIDPHLYDNFNGGDESILFRRTDLANPEESRLFEALLNHESASIREVTSILRRMLWASPHSIPILDCPPEFFELLPHVRNEQPATQSPPIFESSPLVQENTSWQRNTFDFIDDEAIIVEIGAKKKARRSTAQKLSNLNQARIKLSEDMLLFFSPMSWVHQHMNIALKHFDAGHYDSALNTYLRVYKMMNKTNRQNQSFFWCLMGMGYCSALSDKTKLAGNYFLLANREAESESTKSRSGLCLAIIRFESGDEAGAIKILTDIWKSNADLPKAVMLEMKNVYILRPSFFHLLRTFGDRLSDQKDPRALEVLSVTRLVFGELARTNSIQISEESASSMLKLANLYRIRMDLYDAQQLYREVGRTAIRSGLTNLGRNSLFCACSINSALQTKANAEQTKDLDLIVESFSQETNSHTIGVHLRHMISDSLEAAPEDIPNVLTDLCLRMIEKKYQIQALRTAQAAFRVTSEQQLDLNGRLISLIGSLGEADGWACLTSTYLGDDLDARPLLDFLYFVRDFKTLKHIAQRLVDEQMTVPLTQMLMHTAMTQPHSFEKTCTELIDDLENKATARTAFFVTLDKTGKQLVASLDRLFDEQPSQLRNAARILDDQLEHLNAIAVIRATLKSHCYEVEAQSFSNLMMRMSNTQLLMIWMLKLLSDNQSQRFVEFILDPLEHDLPSVSAFVLQLSSENTNNGLELFVSSLRQWGLKEKKLETVLLSAATLCLEQSASLLDVTPVDSDMVLVRIRAFYRLKEIAIDLGVQAQFNELSKSLYKTEYFATLTPLISVLAQSNEANLLQTMTVDMVEFNSESLQSTLTEMAVSRPDKAIIRICKTLLQNGRTPLVVSIATDSRVAKHDEFFKTLSLLLVQELPDDQILALADELVKRDYNDGLAVLIRHAKMLARTDLLIRLMSKFATSTNVMELEDKPQTLNDDAINAMVLLANLDGLADLLYLAALSGDRRLAKILCDLDRNGLTNEQREEVLNKVVCRCWVTLTEYQVRTKAAADPTGKLKVLAVINVAALHRLSALFPHSDATNPTAMFLQNSDIEDFVLAYLLELAVMGELDKIATFAVETGEYGNLQLLRSILLRLAQANHLRTLIVSARKLCAAGLSSLLVLPIQDLAQNGMVDAFGSVSLEVVTNQTCTQSTLLDIIEGLSQCEKNYLRVLLRQVYFYKGLDTVNRLYQDWSNSSEGSKSVVMLDEMRALGYVS